MFYFLRGKHNGLSFFFNLAEYLAFIDPNLYANGSVRVKGRRLAVVHVGAKRLKRHFPLSQPFGSRDLVAVKSAGELNFCSENTPVLHRAFEILLHRSPERETFLNIQGD